MPARAAVTLAALIMTAIAAPGQGVTFADDLLPIVATSCHGCHSTARRKGGIDLEAATTARDVRADAQTWLRAVAQVEAGFMPPKSAPALDDSERQELIAGLRGVLASGDPGAERTTLRRLSRAEYRNTVKDLLGVRVDVRRHFPEDAKGYGFDNIGDVMFVSPLLLERYLDVSTAVVDAVMKDEAARRAVLGTVATAAAPTRDELRTVVQRLLSRAFRRPATDQETEGRLLLMTGVREGGGDLDRALRALLKSALLSPHFLFRVETRPEGAKPEEAWPLDDWELAVRLSYMIWSTMPDPTLGALAREGRLREREVLGRQVRRMLADPRSRAMADHFAAQWLGFGRILDQAVAVRRFKGPFHRLRRVMYEEAARFFDDIVKNDGSILRMIDSEDTYLNQALASHYGVPDVAGRELRRVKLPDRRRGGVLGMAAVLAPTATALRTSPTIRGAWVLENLLGMPPPPPPPDAGQLPADDKDKEGLTLRKQLELHRKDVRCASCHDRMDPLGFALENYDPTGAWRTKVHGLPLDTRGVLPDGTEVDGPAALKDWLMANKDRFARTMAERLLVYATGRPVAPADESVLQEMCAAASANGYRFSAMLESLVKSRAFRFRGG